MRQTVLHVAAQSGNMEVLRYLLNDMQWVKRTWSQLLDARLQTPLHCAAAYGHVQCVGYLSECLPDQRNAQDINGNTPLLLALKKGQLRVAEFFLMNSSPGSLTANTQDSGGFTALHLVCSLGMAKAAGALLKHHGASVNLTTDLVDPLERRWSSKDRYRNVVLVSGRAPYNGRPTKRIAALAGKRATSLEVKTAESELSQPTSAELSYRAGAGRRGYTPILCAILAGSSYSVVELMGVLLKYGAVDNVDDARDLLFYLLTHKEYDMADHFFLSSPAMADEVSRDNKLLCRLCYARDAEGLRWCVDHKCGKLNSTMGGNPLTVATQVGDVGAVRYLLSISADPNVKLAFAENTVSSLQQPASVLLAALYHKQEAVIPILLQAGARLVSGDGKWSALRVAVEQRLESVVLGLLGTNRVNPVDVSQVLVDTLSDYNAPPRDAVAGRLLAHLVQYYDPSASVTHPTELLHMAAHWGQFEVVRRLIDRLVEQPTTLLFELLKETPGPSTRETEQIEPQSSPTDAKWVRLFSAGKSRRGAAGKGPQPFDRLVPPNYKRIRLLKTTLPHRIQCRDVYSYAMEAGEKEVVLRLQRGLRLRPWSTVSLCGFNLADYALQLNDVDMLKFIAALGMRPTRRHGKRLAAGAAAPLIRALNASQSTRYTADDKEGEPTAIMTGVSPSQLSLQVFTRVLVSFIQDRESSAPLLSALVEEHMAQYGVEDLSDAGLWFDPVYASCVTAGRLDYLKLFHDTYSCPLVKTSTEGKRQTAPLLLQAVFRNDVECVRYLLQAGCPAHARGVITTEYAAHIKVKNAESQEISPLCLAAWLGHFEMLQLLASSTPLTIEDCQDVPGEVNADALKALLRGPAVRGKVTAQQDLLLSNTVRTLASARHPFLSPLVMRLAASRGIPLTVQVLLDFYGEKAVETDLRPDEVNSLYYFASHPALCPLLRSLIVQRTVDEFGGERVVLTGFAMTVKEKMTNATVETDARSSIGVVDYALARGCTDGALILLALGLEGTGKAATHHRVSPLVTSIRTVLQHYQKVKDTYTTGQYTVLHSAVELGYKDVVQGLTAEMRLLPKVSTTVAKTEEAAEGGRRRPPVPSVYALAALHPEGWRWAARLEETAAVTNNQTRLRASDFFIFIFNHLPITRVLDMLCRLPENAKVFSHMFTLLDRDGFPSNFLTRQFQLHRPKLFFFGGRYLLTSCTPLACAVAAGSPEWVEYLSFCQPAMSHHKATVTRCLLTLKERTEYVRAATERRKSTTATAGNTDKKKKGGAFRGGQYRNAHPQKRHHACLAYSPSGPLPPLSNEDVSTVDILLLAVVAFCKAYYEGDINRMRLQKNHSQLFAVSPRDDP
ncbi:Ankyrin repeats (3 copies)/Ankyrin repeats (many copies)/Ankyrin repeat, putative [Angomonas deanei]|uniref:Ankyrin repeats (3 copies)/Ankyrin repeats (Many copies)/Ankyrin repeat, putative n=1 Tax=Angomonas deanei TaxID=59799 RepID=A0A7G2CBF9_9TRYP|nr:Ankyrin repeats (3 copies)/Ankyrin repeats (many copies)/Ankyrin repeat, putative [Angomonas deanei]